MWLTVILLIASLLLLFGCGRMEPNSGMATVADDAADSGSPPRTGVGGTMDSLWQPAPGASSGRLAKVLGIPAEQSVVVGEIEGPAVIRHIWITVQSAVPQVQGLLVLRIAWDEESEPSVECPLGDFFGVGYGVERTLRSAMVEMYPAGGENHAALNAYWPMPFRKRARFTIENRSRRPVTMFFLQIDYEKPTAIPDEALYFHAQYRRENPVRRGVPYTILEASGRGVYAGTVLNYHLLGPGAWVEGGNDVYIDGAETPTLPAVGGEDYFGHAWGFRTETNGLWHGTSFGPEDNRMTAYRWHVPDPIHFSSSIRMTLRDHGWDVGDRQDDYSSVAFWYQTEPHAPFPALPAVDYDFLQVPEELRRSAADLFSPDRLPPPPPGRNLSREARDWKASGSYNDESAPAFAFDGRLDTKWCDATIPDGEWIALDFGADKTINGCVLKNAETIGDPAGFNAKSFRVESGPSLDGPWETVVRVDNTRASANPDLGAAVATVTFDKPVVARCVRLVVEDAGYLDPIARVQELEFYGQ